MITTTWQDILADGTTKRQRRAMYRLGLSRSLVKQINSGTAEDAINGLLALQSKIRSEESVKDKGNQTATDET
jgi:hypothetical protein